MVKLKNLKRAISSYHRKGVNMKRFSKIIGYQGNGMVEIAQAILSRLVDGNAVLTKSEARCKSCYDTGKAPVYENGKRHLEKCPGWQSVPVTDKYNRTYMRSFCLGDPEWEERKAANIGDLLYTIKEHANKQGLTFRDVELYSEKAFPAVKMNNYEYDNYELLLNHLHLGLVTKQTEQTEQQQVQQQAQQQAQQQEIDCHSQ